MPVAWILDILWGGKEPLSSKGIPLPALSSGSSILFITHVFCSLGTFTKHMRILCVPEEEEMSVPLLFFSVRRFKFTLLFCITNADAGQTSLLFGLVEPSSDPSHYLFNSYRSD